MKKKTRLLIGTHNDGKFKEISNLVNKNIKKISPKKLNIAPPRETGKTFKSNSELKATSIKASVLREKLQDNNWVSDGFSDGLARKIEDLILTRARELRNSSN